MAAEVYVPIVNTLLSSFVSLVVAFGTWHVTMKQSRKKDTDALKQALAEHKDQMKDALNEGTKVTSQLQTQITLIDSKLDTLSERVEKHNNVIERTYKLEQATAVMEEQIKVANHRINDLEDK